MRASPPAARVIAVAPLMSMPLVGSAIAIGPFDIPSADPLLVWTHPEVITYQDIQVEVPDGVAVATDGSTFFYASTSPPGPLLPGSRCSEARAGIDAAMAFLDETKCRFARHPAVACSGTTICATAAGATLLSGPVVARQAGGVGILSATSYNYAQFGLAKDVIGITSYGESASIAMTSTSDTFYKSDECHFRWGGMTWASGTFMQAGTAMCAYYTPGNWKTFCYGWDDNRAATTWQYWGSETSDTASHRYSVASTSGGTLYACKQDSTTLYLNTADHSSYANPGLDSILEIATGTTLDSATTAGVNKFAPAIQYTRGPGWAWEAPPSENYYAWTWNSGTGSGQSACNVFNIGAKYYVGQTPYPVLRTGTGQTCPAQGSTAW